jgi:hypothetical protein
MELWQTGTNMAEQVFFDFAGAVRVRPSPGGGGARLRDLYDPEQIYLFGSASRADAGTSTAIPNPRHGNPGFSRDGTPQALRSTVADGVQGDLAAGPVGGSAHSARNLSTRSAAEGKVAVEPICTGRQAAVCPRTPEAAPTLCPEFGRFAQTRIYGDGTQDRSGRRSAAR